MLGNGKISSCSTSDICRVNIVTNPWCHEWGKDREVFTTSGTYPWSFVTHIFHNGRPSHGDDRKTLSEDFNWTKRNPWFSSFIVSSNPLSMKSWYEPKALEYRINREWNKEKEKCIWFTLYKHCTPLSEVIYSKEQQGSYIYIYLYPMKFDEDDSHNISWYCCYT